MVIIMFLDSFFSFHKIIDTCNKWNLNLKKGSNGQSTHAAYYNKGMLITMFNLHRWNDRAENRLVKVNDTSYFYV